MRKWFLFLVSVAVLLVLVRAAGFREVAAVWRSIEPAAILVSAGCYFGALGARIAGWRTLLGPDAPSFRALGPPLALGFLLGHLTPAKSGEPAPALLVSRAFDLPLARTLSVLTAERALQLLVLLATFVPAAAFYAGTILEIRGAAITAGALLAVLVAGTLAAGPLLRRLEPGARRIPRVGPVAGDYLAALAELLSSRRQVVPLLVLGTVYWGFQYVSLWAILVGGGTSVNLVGAAVVAGAAILGGTLTMIPLGTQDGISAVVLAGLGVDLARGFSLALFHTVLSLACGLALLVVLPFTGRRVPPPRD